MTSVITTSTLNQQSPPPSLGQVNISDNTGALALVTSTTQAVSGSSGVTNSITLSAVNAGIFPGMVVTGTNIPSGTTVLSVNGTALLLSKSTTGNAGTLTFALTGKVVRVWRYDLCVAAGADLTFNSYNSTGPVTTPLYGPVGLASTNVNSLYRGFTTAPHFQTLVGEDLRIAVSTASRLSGTIALSVGNP